MNIILILFISIGSFVSAQLGKSTITSNKDSSLGSIKFGPPDLNDDESHYSHVPADLRCDACTAIVNRFSHSLQKKIDLYPSVKDGNKNLNESQLIEIFDKICSDREWNSYGLKEVDGVKRITYPDSDINKIPGITQAGGQWPQRFSKMCYEFLGEFDEEELYNEYRLHLEIGLHKTLCTKFCKSNKKRRNKKEL